MIFSSPTYSILLYSIRFLVFLQRRRASTCSCICWPSSRSKWPPSFHSPSVRLPWSPVRLCCSARSLWSCPWSSSCKRFSANNTRRPSHTRWSHNTTTKFTEDTTHTVVPALPTSHPADTAVATEVVHQAAAVGDAASTPNKWPTAPKHRRLLNKRTCQTWVSGPAFATSAANVSLRCHAYII